MGNKSNEIHWTLLFNESQSQIKDAVIQDYPDRHQVVDYESLKITVLEMNAKGEYTESEEKLILDKDYRILEKVTKDDQKYFDIYFLQTIEKMLQIEYISEIVADEEVIQNGGLSIRNDVTIEGFESKIKEEQSEGVVQIQLQELSETPMVRKAN